MVVVVVIGGGGRGGGVCVWVGGWRVGPDTQAHLYMQSARNCHHGMDLVAVLGQGRWVE